MSSLWPPAALTAATGGRLAHPFAATGGRLAHPFAATGVSIDTRTLVPGDLFVALLGAHGDGHDHVAAALAAGAAGAMVQRRPADVLADAALLVVADTLAGLTGLGAAGRARFAGRVVAVTGSVGKTTTKEMLRLALAATGAGAGAVHAAQASHNNHWGVPLTLARMPAGAAIGVVEIGMNQAGEIAPLAALARPDLAIVTNVGATHIGHLGSLAAIADEKAALVEALGAAGVAVLPADCAFLPRLLIAAGRRRVIRFGVDAGAEVRLVDLVEGAEGSAVTAAIGGRTIRFGLAAPGRHMALNALAALAAAYGLGLDGDDAAARLGAFAAGPGRGARRRIAVAGGTALLLDESYNASAASIRAALAVLALQPARRRVAVLGDMLELGHAAAAEHVGLAGAVCAQADLLFACGPQMRGLYDAIPSGQRGAHTATAATLAPIVAARARAGDAILVKGSLGSRMASIVAALDAG